MRKVIIFLFCSILILSFATPALAADPIRVFYAGEQSGVYAALKLAPAGTFEFVDDPSTADVFVLNGEVPQAEEIARQVEAGTGLVLILGGKTDAESVTMLTGVPVELTAQDSPASLTELKIDDPLVTEIIWNGAPQVRERYSMLTPFSSVQPLVTTYEDGSWILWHARDRMFVWNAFLSEGANPQIQDWAYFNYLIYHLTVRAAGQTPMPFADYPSSPVPHTAERNILWLVMALMITTTFTAFFFVRRWSLNHPEALDNIVANRNQFETRSEATEWEDVGFHRPLSGFLVALSMGLVLFIPLIIYQNLILPVYILPSAQALGIWGRVTQFFNLAWMFFDMGTSVAFIKYLSEYRVHDPKKGIQYGQLFVWWQALSGAVQVALVIGLASTYAPNSAYALYAWSVIIHALIQVPGFYQVMRHALNGFQRQDYARYLDLGLQVVMPMVVQPLFVGVMYAWGKSHPVFGGSMGGLLGMGIAAYAAELFTFLLGMWLYRRIGYNPAVLFMAHFDWDVVKTSFRFGVFEMLGSAAWASGQAAEIWITQSRLINYAEIWGNWGLAQNFVFAFNVIQTLNDGAMPAISEAISNGRKMLSQYYSVQMYKWGSMVSAFLGAVLLAVGPRFILGASGVEFERAALYLVPLAIWGAIQYPSWVGDNAQLGAGRPDIKSILIFGEQVVRVVFAWILLEHLQVTALIVAYFIGLISKGIVAYFINHRICYPQRFFAWQSAAAPLLAGAVHYGLLYWISGMIWQGDDITSILIFFIGILPSFPVYMFLFGLFGGWDDATLDELRDAVGLTGFVRPLAWVVWASTASGARISPLHGRFPISIREAALAEAKGLTDEKVKL